jgi:hypothetical protein
MSFRSSLLWRSSVLVALALLPACGTEADLQAEQASADSKPVELAQVSGYKTSASCSTVENEAINRAHSFLYEELRGPLANSFRSCMAAAPLVECSCGDQFDRSAIVDDILADQFWSFECVDFKPGMDADGSQTFVLADSHVGISGTRMRVDRSFLRSNTTQFVAAVMAHELAHNRGYRHDAHPFGSPEYELTVPEQVHACVASASVGGATPNPLVPGHVNKLAMCLPDQHWCEDGSCFWTAQDCYCLDSSCGQTFCSVVVESAKDGQYPGGGLPLSF